MADCPCCGEPLPPSAVPNELCAACGRAMVTGADPAQPEIQPQAVRRPAGVSVLSIYLFLGAAALAGVAVFAVARLFLGAPDRPDGAYIAWYLFLAFLMFAVGVGFWRLSEWARLVSVVCAALLLISPGPSSTAWFRALNVALMIYLMSPRVRAAFVAAEKANQPIIVDQWVLWFHWLRGA